MLKELGLHVDFKPYEVEMLPFVFWFKLEHVDSPHLNQIVSLTGTSVETAWGRVATLYEGYNVTQMTDEEISEYLAQSECIPF